MGWFTTSHKPKKALRDELWTQCPGCKTLVYKQEWAANLKVCPKCNYHGRLSCYERVELLIDTGTFEPRDEDVTANDPLNFTHGGGKYSDKIAQTTEKTGLKEAVLSGRGKIEGIDVVIAIMDFRFFGGSLGSGAGELIHRAAQRAVRRKLPLIVIAASGGARMQEGLVSLMQMAKTCSAIAMINQAGLPYISILTNPTMGGVSASFATVGDLNITEPGALIGFAGRRVIENTIRQKLPDDFQTAEYLLEHGFIDTIVPRKTMKADLARMMRYMV
jgi:acetyl-CoA carboxylase carboxyl transferase subunit beta